MPALELKVPPVALAALFAAAMLGLSSLTPAATFVFPDRTATSLGLMVLGFAIALAGVVAFRTHKTTVNPLTPGASSVAPLDKAANTSSSPRSDACACVSVDS